MNPMLHIRTVVFRVTQDEMGQIAGAGQAAVSRWENDATAPTRKQLGRIRAEAMRRGLVWDDSWFFEAPVEAAE
jgi:transcriptional regulator with XRE-family HTH domain